MRGLLGKLLEGEYQRMAKMLRDQGVQPVGYAVLGTPGGAVGRSGYGAPQPMATGYGGGYATGYGHTSGYGGASGYNNRGMGAPTGWQGDSQQSPWRQRRREAILTVGILRQMLAGADPFNPPGYGLLPPDDRATGQPLGECPAAVPSVPGPLGSAYAAIPAVAVDAMEDMAQLERLVNRLAGGAQTAAPVVRLACASAVGTTHLHGSFCGAHGIPGGGGRRGGQHDGDAGARRAAAASHAARR